MYIMDYKSINQKLSAQRFICDCKNKPHRKFFFPAHSKAHQIGIDITAFNVQRKCNLQASCCAFFGEMFTTSIHVDIIHTLLIGLYFIVIQIFF